MEFLLLECASEGVYHLAEIRRLGRQILPEASLATCIHMEQDALRSLLKRGLVEIVVLDPETEAYAPLAAEDANLLTLEPWIPESPGPILGFRFTESGRHAWKESLERELLALRQRLAEKP